MVGVLSMTVLLLASGEPKPIALDILPGDARRRHIEDIRDSRHEYTVTMRGNIDGPMTRDPIGYGGWRQSFEPNVEVVMTNHGPAVAKNPWLTINGRGRWRTIGELVDSIVTPDMSDAAKARALWEWHRRHRFHSSTNTDESSNAVKVYNVYGYTLCGNDSVVVADLWRQAGLKVRAGKPQGHSTTEVFYDGAWHLLDGDENIICLHPDNKTIAGEDEIIRDHELMKLTHTYGILRPDGRKADEFSAALHCRQDAKHGRKSSGGKHAMHFDLRPGESMIWRWSNVHKWYGTDRYGSWKRVGKQVANGQLVYAPSFAAKSGRQHIGHIDNGKFVEQADQSCIICPTAADKPMRLVVEMRSPYVIVGGRVDADPRGAGTSDRAGIDISFDRKTWQRVRPARQAGDIHPDVRLDEYFPRSGRARYRVWLRFEPRGNTSPDTVALRGFKITLDLQMAPLTLPGLTLGKNVVAYTDETSEPHEVRVTHRWIERSAWQRPPAPKIVSPTSDDRTASTRPHFRWKRPERSDGAEIVDYQFQLSEFADMRWVLSPNFDKLIRRTAYRGKVAKELRDGYEPPYDGLLNPGRPYYWRVRARDLRGVWSAWSDAVRFIPKGPGVPVGLKLDVDRKTARASLRWQPSPEGRKPTHYEIHGSDERGFSPSRTHYDVVVGNNQTRRIGPNLIATTKDTTLKVVGADLDPGRFNRVYYRVVAVDADGVRSRATTFVEAPHPMFVSVPPSDVRVGRAFAYSPKVTSSIGHLVGYTAKGSLYNYAFRWGDELTFSMPHGPSWLRIDPKTGRLTGTPPIKADGRASVELHVTSRLGGKDSRRFELRILP